MVSAPRSESAWLSFVGSVVSLYVGLVFFLTDTGPVEAVVTGTFNGLSIAITVALLVVVWRGVPDLLFPDDREAAGRE